MTEVEQPPILTDPLEALKQLKRKDEYPKFAFEGRVDSGDQIEDQLHLADMIQNHVDYWIFRQYGPAEYNTYITYKDSDDYHMRRGQHTLGVDIDTPGGIVNVELTADYQWMGSSKNHDNEIQWVAAKIRFADQEESCKEFTITEFRFDLEPFIQGEGIEVYRERQDARRARRLPPKKDLEMFAAVLPVVTEAMQAKYPLSRDVLKQTHPGTKITVERWGGPNDEYIV